MIELHIGGMNCQHCVKAVTDALSAVAGVERVESVDLESGRALVAGDVDPRALVAAVSAAGYQASLVS